jgi:hypothetical protein
VFLGVNKTLKGRSFGWKTKVGWIEMHTKRSSGNVGEVYGIANL